MGFFSSVGKAIGKQVGESFWPLYGQADRMSGELIKKYIDDNANFTRKAVFLLALSKRDRYEAKKIYARDKHAYTNAFNGLRNYSKFVPIIDRFMMECG